MSAGFEVVGRRESVHGNRMNAVAFYISDDGTTNIPVRATTEFPGDSTGVNARKCIAVDDDENVIPGLHFHTAQFVNMVQRV